jgi:hypothetical protein
MNFDEARVSQFPEDTEHIPLTLGRFDAVLGDDGVADSGDGGRSGDQSPDTGPYRIESVICAGLQVEDGGFAAEVAGNLVGGDLHYGSESHGTSGSDFTTFATDEHGWSQISDLD